MDVWCRNFVCTFFQGELKVKVRARSKYVFNPIPLDRFDSRTQARLGQVVRVVKKYGCPPPNTMGHCHIESLSGQFLGLVHINSLMAVPEDYRYWSTTGMPMKISPV